MLVLMTVTFDDVDNVKYSNTTYEAWKLWGKVSQILVQPPA